MAAPEPAPKKGRGGRAGGGDLDHAMADSVPASRSCRLTMHAHKWLPSAAVGRRALRPSSSSLPAQARSTRDDSVGRRDAGRDGVGLAWSAAIKKIYARVARNAARHRAPKRARNSRRPSARGGRPPAASTRPRSVRPCRGTSASGASPRLEDDVLGGDDRPTCNGRLHPRSA